MTFGNVFYTRLANTLGGKEIRVLYDVHSIIRRIIRIIRRILRSVLYYVFVLANLELSVPE